MPGDEWPGQNWCPDRPDIHVILERAEIDACDLVPIGSNYVFALRLTDGEAGEGLAIYKPERGEAPLWDYPTGELYKRELATYLLSLALGWQIVPPTIIRVGPHGVGMAQLFIEHDQRKTFFELREAHAREMRRIALFDAVVNNGDRKGGHCLLGVDGRIWGIDHGLTFHIENKLRTVIWDYAGEALPDDLLPDLRRLQSCLHGENELLQKLRQFLSRQEVGALRQRLDRLIQDPRFPRTGYRRPVPWPPV